MLCTRCHHDIHRYGWEIVVHANRVSFIPPPTVDPHRKPLPGGAGAVELENVGLVPDYADPGGMDPGGVDDYFADEEAMVLAWNRGAQQPIC